MNPIRKAVLGGVLVAGTVAGGAVGVSMLSTAASADSAHTTAVASSSARPAPPKGGNPDPSRGGHQANGITETLLTGTTKTKVEAAAKAAVPGGTILRVENDAEGAKYEAHVRKADGSQVTVKVDADFKVTGVESGPA